MMQHRNRSLALIAFLLGVLSLAACSNKKENPQETKGATPSPEAKPSGPATELNLLLFPDYIDEKILKDFEKQNNARVRLTRYDNTEEMEAKLAYTGADSQYDVVVMASQVMPRLVRRGLLRTLDHSKIPNRNNLEPRFAGPSFDEGNKHSIPYQFGSVGIVYNKKKFPTLENTWGVVLDPQKVVGTFVLLDELRDMLGATLKYKGFSSNSTNPEEVRAAGRTLKEAKAHPRCLGFKGGVGAMEDVKGGSVDMAVVWNGDAAKHIKADKEQRLDFMYPKEGSVLWVDVMVITTKAPNPDLAHKFINFVLTPEAGAQLSLYTKYSTPNAAAQTKLPDEDRNNLYIYPPADVSMRLEHHRDLGEGAKLFDEAWTEIKSN